MSKKKTSGWNRHCKRCNEYGPAYGRYSRLCIKCVDSAKTARNYTAVRKAKGYVHFLDNKKISCDEKLNAVDVKYRSRLDSYNKIDCPICLQLISNKYNIQKIHCTKCNKYKNATKLNDVLCIMCEKISEKKDDTKNRKR